MNLRYLFYIFLISFSRSLFGRSFLYRYKKLVISCFVRSIFPLFSYAHWKKKNWEQNNPDAPWLVQDSILFLEEWLKNDMKGFEFELVRSPKWFTQRVSFYFLLKVTFSDIKNFQMVFGKL